jgi:hypothetical protein
MRNTNSYVCTRDFSLSRGRSTELFTHTPFSCSRVSSTNVSLAVSAIPNLVCLPASLSVAVNPWNTSARLEFFHPLANG